MIGSVVALLQEMGLAGLAISVGESQWTPGHTVSVVTASITAISALAAALLANRSRQHSRAARVQVENEHLDDDGNVYNLRDNIDANRGENLALGQAQLAQLAQIQISVNGVKSDIRGLRADIGRLYDHDDEIRRDIRDLDERTQNPWERPAPRPSSRRAQRYEREAQAWTPPATLGDPSDTSGPASPGSTS